MKFPFYLLFAAALATSCAGKKEKQAPPQPPIHYTVHGSGDTTLLFVHGWCINGNYWNSQVEYFKNRYKVVTVDLAGHGRSPAGQKAVTIPEFAAGIDSVIGYLGLKNIVLVGHSMSGNINLHVWNRNRSRVLGFIGIDNFQRIGYEPNASEQQQEQQFLDTLKKDYARVVPALATGWLFHAKTDSLVRKRVLNDIAQMDPSFSVSALSGLSKEYRTEQELFPQMNIPLALVIAEGTWQNDSAHKKYCAAGFRVWSIANCGHYPMVEHPEQFNKKLEEAIAFSLTKNNTKQ